MWGRVGGREGRPRAEGKEEKLIPRLLTTRQLEDLHLSRRLLPAILTSTSHFFHRLAETATHLQMIHVAGRIRADVGGAPPSENRSSGGKTDPLFIKDLLFALYTVNLKLKGFQSERRCSQCFFFLSGLRVNKRIKCSGGRLCRPPTFCFGCKLYVRGVGGRCEWKHVSVTVISLKQDGRTDGRTGWPAAACRVKTLEVWPLGGALINSTSASV